MDTLDITRVETAVGWLEVAASQQGARCVLPLPGEGLESLRTGARLGEAEVRPHAPGAPLPPMLARTVEALRAQLSGQPVGDVPLDTGGTPFQQRVWGELLRVPFGATTTYGALTRRLGLAPGAARAVGGAVGANPLCILIPCHRVVGRGGELTGFAWGLELKAALLAHEGAPLQRPLFGLP